MSDNNWFIDWEPDEIERIKKFKALNKGWRKMRDKSRVNIKQPEYTYFKREEGINFPQYARFDFAEGLSPGSFGSNG